MLYLENKERWGIAIPYSAIGGGIAASACATKYVKNLPAEPQKFPRILGRRRASWTCLLRTSYFPPMMARKQAVARNPERVSKESPGAFGLGVQKVSETVSKQSPESKQSILRLRRLFRDCFGHFSESGAGRPRETLLRLFRDRPGRLL